MARFILLTCLLMCGGILNAHNHGHSHNNEENPSFKYSRSANEKYHHDEHHNVPPTKAPPMATSQLWLHAMGSTLLISAAPFFILFFVPLDDTDSKQPLLKILLAFASGGLLGDAFLHLIPHATMAVGNHHHHDDHHHHHHSHANAADDEEGHSHDMSVGLWILAGIVTFLVVEKGVRIIKGGHTHSHSHTQKKPADSKDNNKKKTEKQVEADSKDNNKKKTEKQDETKKEIKVAGYLNLAADFSHNFTDGLAIGSSYLAGNTVGIITTITILLHEVPHEIGDFAILLQSGVSRKNAMLLQLTTALGALIGTAISLFAQNTHNMPTEWILPFTAGGFIYIALVSVIPELLDEEEPNFVQTLLQIGAMLGGVGMMVLIAEYE